MLKHPSRGSRTCPTFFCPCFSAGLSGVLRDNFRLQPGDLVTTAGQALELDCVPPLGYPEPYITWKKDGVTLDLVGGRYTVTKGKLQVASAQRSDSGLYICVAANAAGRRESATSQPLGCSARGDPAPQLFLLQIRGGKLMVASTHKSDAGVYVCVATNVVGERDSEPAELVVFERPAFGKRPQNQVVLVEGTAQFACEVMGDPQPAARWRKEEGEMPLGRWEVLPDNTLRIRQLQVEDEGTYTCVADNSVGRSEASGTLTVHGKGDRGEHPWVLVECPDKPLSLPALLQCPPSLSPGPTTKLSPLARVSLSSARARETHHPLSSGRRRGARCVSFPHP
uniref:Ig-like domain-containing protein n=1 Tax=Junco hyemalis TaxID=40217 RepID=A0A8C5NR92_JUNHY